MRNISLTQLSYLLALDECRHFGLAAQKCHVTQPTLSMQVQKLEEELGVILFDRSRQPVVPTEIGDKLIQQARVILQETRQIDEILVSESKDPSGRYKLGVIPTLAPYLLPFFVPKFLKKLPKVSLIIDELTTDSIIDQLRKDELDGAILATPLHQDLIQETPIFYEPFWAYVSDAHPLSKRNELRASELEQSDLWLLKEGHCFREQVLRLCGTNSLASQDRKLGFESGNLEALKGLVDEGFGMTLLPDLAVRRISEPRQRKRVHRIENGVLVREVSLVQSRPLRKKKIAEALVEVIRESVPEELLPKKTVDRKVIGLS